MARKPRKVRVDFRQNRQQTRRSDDWTRRYHADESLLDEKSVESVRAKGDLSRKRTIIVDENLAPVVDQSLWRRGVVVAVLGVVVQVRDDAGLTWDCSVRRVLRTVLVTKRSTVAAGDAVWISDQSRLHDGAAAGVIERVEPRRSSLSRGDFRGREHTIVANADQLVIVASVARPRLKPHLIDRYLVAAGKGALRPIICFNKCDLLDRAAQTEGEPAPSDEPQERDEHEPEAPDAEAPADGDEEYEWVEGPLTIEEIVDEFESLGYCCIPASAASGEGVDALRAELRGHITVLSGQSGVGKSSLINAVQPGLELTVGEVSDENEKGRHTTTHARLLPLNGGGFVVDTPGIRQFDLWNTAPGEVEAFFPEIAQRTARCRFNDCHHRDEVGCAVRSAADAGEISARRYGSYLKMVHELSRSQRRRG